MKSKRLLIIGILVFAAIVVGVSIFLLPNKPDSSSSNKPRYLVSLGDSVAAGAGLEADSQFSSGPYASCQLSKQAYPYILADKLGAELKQFACSGATIDGAINQAQFTDVPPQITAAQPYIAGNDVVISVGINDISGLTLVAQCAQASECVNAQQQAALDTAMAKLRSNLSQLLSTLQASKPNRIVINTYYSLLASGDTCFANYGFTSEKVDRIIQLEADVNDLITETGREGGVTVVNVDYDGHTLCTGTPWIQGLLNKAPLHPTEAGQKQIANQDFEALR